MPGFSDVSHCDTCGSCTATCNISGLTDFSHECEEGWTFDVNKWVTSSVGSFNRSTTGTSDPWKLTVTFLITWQTTTTKNISLRVVGGAADDCLSFWYADYIWGRNGSTATLRRRLGDCDTGVEDILASHPFEFLAADSAGSEPLIPESGTSTVTIAICWDGDKLTFESGGFSSPLTTDAILHLTDMVTPHGEKGGFKVLTMSGVTSVEVTTVLFERVVPEPTDCVQCYSNDCLGLVPYELLVEISTVVSPGTHIANSCEFQCSHILGTFTVSAIGDSSNLWRLVFNDPTAVDCIFDQITIQVTVDRTTSTTRTITVTVTWIPGGFVIPQRLGTWVKTLYFEPCVDWIDWIEIPTDSFATNHCNPAGDLTCRIKIA